MTLSADSLNTIRKRLTTRREEFRTRLTRIGSDQRREVDPLSADAPDRAIQRENDDVIDSLGIVGRAELSETEAALARLASGHYGSCEHCGHPIESKRLEAIPQARQCLRCAAEPDARSSAA
jgi:RNA polymerase-binding transcription factor DksA